MSGKRGKSPQQRKAEARNRHRLKELDSLGAARAAALEVKRRQERNRQVRAHTQAVLAARRNGSLSTTSSPEWLLLEESA